MGNKIILVGGGGNCRSIIDVLLERDDYSEIGIVDCHKIDISCFPNKVKYLGDDSLLSGLINDGWKDAFVSLGSIGDTSNRRRLYNILKENGYTVPNIISTSAVISPFSKFGEGIFVGKGAVINVNCIINNCVIINSNSTIEHDCEIGQFVHVSSGATLCGMVSVASDSHIGAGSVVKQGIHIGNNSLVGIGSVVTKDVEPYSVYYGNPARFVRKNNNE